MSGLVTWWVLLVPCSPVLPGVWVTGDRFTWLGEWLDTWQDEKEPFKGQMNALVGSATIEHTHTIMDHKFLINHPWERDGPLAFI